jgi:hypothetical protein
VATRSIAHSVRRLAPQLGDGGSTIWLLVGLIAMQVIGLGILAVIGPAHTHRAGAEPSRLVLEDFRRGPIQTIRSTSHVASAFGHVHRFDGVLRHHHRAQRHDRGAGRSRCMAASG